MIAKADATNDGSNYNLYYDYDKGDLSLTNYSTADGTNSSGNLGTKLSDDFITWTEGALSDFNGKANTQVIAASSSNAKDMCKVLETFNVGSDNEGHNDWYVPAAGQLALMYLAKTDINAVLAKIGGTALESNNYWSSSEVDANLAWRVSFGSGYVNSSNKGSLDRRVRFVRDISVSKPLKERVSELESKVNCIKFTNKTANAWIEDPTYSDFKYKCDIACEGVTADMYAEVVFNVDQAVSGNYAPVCETKSNVVSVWSFENATITIPTIIITK